MTFDDVARATVPTAIRVAPEIELDGAYNAAHSHLRNTDPGVVRQMEACIRAISDERARRRAKWPLRISIFALIVSAIAAAFSVRASLRRDLTPRVQALELRVPAVESELRAHSHSATPTKTTPALPSSTGGQNKP